eukprot:5214456-Pyramimonas_sp.AAC.1
MSPAALPFLSDAEGLMLRAHDEFDWVKYEATSSFADAGWKRMTNRKKLALEMWRAGMLACTEEVKEKVGIFTVVKSMVEGSPGKVEKSRLVWDCRRLNLRFRKPPWTGLGSPSALASLDLSQEVLKDQELMSLSGDIPDRLSRLRWPKELAEHCALELLSASELRERAMGQGAKVPEPDADDVGMGAIAP